MQLILIIIVVIASMVMAQGDIINCSNYEELILKRFSLEPFKGKEGDFRSGKIWHSGPQEKELYLSDFFNTSSVISDNFVVCEEKKTYYSICWTDTATVRIYSNGVVVQRGQTYERYLISGENVNLHSKIQIGDCKERVLEVLGKPRGNLYLQGKNRWTYTSKAESDPFSGALYPEYDLVHEEMEGRVPITLFFIDDRLSLIDCQIYIDLCEE
ncbi:hypothetical protein QA601_18265 [Chitinispirillales bacterium ANBcel5]|uniref:hypothetical protein n=1 Tax=Cellulosispirillum alkaliphilum TaxID=3039283 RepID=UPI002A515C11|nr:hypothetical protein [Chitinispirillales bacterium ANBcel5]